MMKKLQQGNLLYIKNMVCNRCIMVVEEQLKALGLSPLLVELGVVTLPGPLEDSMLVPVKNALEAMGFELIDDRRTRLVEQLKTAIIQLVHHNDGQLKMNLSDYLTETLHADYSSLSKLFSEVAGITLEKYFIAQKVERVKELLVYDELSLNEIADKLNYSSVAHLSSQFKAVTGLTPQHFKQIGAGRRKPLDRV